MSSKEQELVRIMKDPVLWAEKHIGEKPRWYQEQILRHPHNRIALRCGRRLGKCIASDQRIMNPHTGAYETVEDLFEKQQVDLYTLNDDYKFETSSSFHIEDNGVKPVFEVETKNGASVKLTGNHPVLTIDGWKDVDDLEVGEYIATPKALPMVGKGQTPRVNKAKTLGYLKASFEEQKTGPTLSVSSPTYIDDITQVLKNEGITLVQKSKKSYYLFNDKKYEEYDELFNDKKEIPEEVFGWDKKSLAIFLAAYFDMNGWTHAGRIAEIGTGHREKPFLVTMKHLLLRFGIEANVLQRQTGGRPYYQLMIHPKKDLSLFLEEISPYGFRDYTAISEKLETMVAREATLPPKVWEYVEIKRLEKGITKRAVMGGDRYRVNSGITEEKANTIADNLEDNELKKLANSQVYWKEVVAITPKGSQQTYDVSVPETHNLVVEDVVVHNTWTMAVHMLWGIFTYYGGTLDKAADVVVATPYDTQARLIFEQLKEFIDENEILSNSVERIVQSPYLIKFKNGGKITLFTAGTKSGQGAASLRGQRSDSPGH